jgi:hypothetical protein
LGKLSILGSAVPDSVPVIGAQKKAKTVTRDHNLQQIGGLDSPAISGETLALNQALQAATTAANEVWQQSGYQGKSSVSISRKRDNAC